VSDSCFEIKNVVNCNIIEDIITAYTVFILFISNIIMFTFVYGIGVSLCNAVLNNFE